MEKQITQKDFGLVVEWWYENSLVIIRGSGDMSRKALDYWGDNVVESLNGFPEHLPVFMMFDLSSPAQGFTPYSRAVIDRIYTAVPVGKPVYVGIYMREGIISRIISLYVNRREGKNLKMRLLFTEDDVINWLQVMMKQHGVLDDDELVG
ncbi:MAG: hypothetical protein SFZ02_18810 [bacterium]|nr:hypothetical protein [bacterium]